MAALCAEAQALKAVHDRLSSSLTVALAAQQQLQQSLLENAQQQSQLVTRIEADQAAIADLEGKITATAAEIAGVTRQIESDQKAIALLARQMYMRPSNLLLRIVAAGSLRLALLQAADWSVEVQRAHTLKVRLDNDRAALVTKQDQLRSERDALAASTAALQRDLAELADLQHRQAQASVQLQAQIDRTRNELSKVDKQTAVLANGIMNQIVDDEDRLVADAMAAAWTQAAVWIDANSPALAPPGSGHSTQSRFIWPEPAATISQGFGPTDFWMEPPYQGFAHFHSGLDLVEPLGSPVLACDDGVVAAVGSGQTGYGNYVVLAHPGGLTTLYGHLALAGVRIGDHVQQGQAIGIEGSTGNSTGPHLHFEVRSAGQPVDPLPFLPAGAPAGTRA